MTVAQNEARRSVTAEALACEWDLCGTVLINTFFLLKTLGFTINKYTTRVSNFKRYVQYVYVVEFADREWKRRLAGVMWMRSGVRQCQSKALFTSHANLKYFLFHPSHRIFRRIHGALNIGKKNN
jgi:hypothetical protein